MELLRFQLYHNQCLEMFLSWLQCLTHVILRRIRRLRSQQALTFVHMLVRIVLCFQNPDRFKLLRYSSTKCEGKTNVEAGFNFIKKSTV